MGEGFFNTFVIPFYSSINVTIELGGPPEGGEYTWWIFRGRTKATLILPGSTTEPLPPHARLVSYESPPSSVPPYGAISILNASAERAGAVVMTTVAVRAPKQDFAFLEGCVRALPGTGSEWLLSSGTEDYFLGSFYFDQGPYLLELAGVTALCPQPPCADCPSKVNATAFGCNTDADSGVVFSAYRVHSASDPVMFDGGLAVTWRNGEPGHGGGQRFSVNASTFALVYEWDV